MQQLIALFGWTRYRPECIHSETGMFLVVKSPRGKGGKDSEGKDDDDDDYGCIVLILMVKDNGLMVRVHAEDILTVAYNKFQPRGSHPEPTNYPETRHLSHTLGCLFQTSAYLAFHPRKPKTPKPKPFKGSPTFTCISPGEIQKGPYPCNGTVPELRFPMLEKPRTSSPIGSSVVPFWDYLIGF